MIITWEYWPYDDEETIQQEVRTIENFEKAIGIVDQLKQEHGHNLRFVDIRVRMFENEDMGKEMKDEG